MPKFVINADYSGSTKVVEADSFRTAGDYIDFMDEEGIVFRILAKNVYTVERES
ncbi:hypothetical protein ABT215_07825 [Streptomyces sp900105755]|uniref:hypothetical protein n=1 Tax=Streptomyces sp. 900105755 TaxID=3154389 RepID=UPI00332E2D90